MARNVLRRPDGSAVPLTSDQLKSAQQYPTPPGSLVSSNQVMGSIVDQHLRQVGHDPAPFVPDPRNYEEIP
jgi:hypothetical protein